MRIEHQHKSYVVEKLTNDVNDNQEAIIAVVGTFLGIIVFLPIFSEEGFSSSVYLDPQIIISLGFLLPIVFVVILISIKSNNDD